MKCKSEQNFSSYAKEYKSKYLQYNCEKNLQLDMKGAFFASLDETISFKMCEWENLPMTMIRLLDNVICLDNMWKLARLETLSTKRLFGKKLGMKILR